MGDEVVMNGLEPSLEAVCGLGSQLYRWDFSVFELHKLTGGRPLYHVTMALLKDQGLLDGWLLDRAVVERYLTHVEKMYKGNPYHNNTHAADVTQTAGVIMSGVNRWLSMPIGTSSITSTHNNCNPTSGGCGTCASQHHSTHKGALRAAAAGPPGGADSSSSSSSPGQQPADSSSSNNSINGNSVPSGLSKLERFAIILASAVHDLGHPGVNNAFLVRTRDPQALTFNDRSVNEMMHASLAFKLALENPELNIFAPFSQTDFELVRKLVLEMVLSTDMDVHFALLKRYEDALRAQPDVRQWQGVEQRSLMFQMLVHLADLANPSRPWHLALKWAEWVVTEFLSQGEKEAAAGIPISPPCDQSKVCMPAAQLFFIERFMAPTLEIFKTSAPSFYDMASAWLADTRGKWSTFQAAGVKFPHQDYPQLPAPSAAEQSRLSTTLCGSQRCCSACRMGRECCCGEPQQQQQQCKVAKVEVAPLQHQHQVGLQHPAQQAAAQAAG